MADQSPASPSAGARWLTAADWLIPPKLRGSVEARQRARISVLFPLPMAAFAFAMALVHLAFEHPRQALLVGCAGVMGVLSVGLLRLTRSLVLSVYLQQTLLVGALDYLAWRTGGATTPTLFLSFVAPMLAGLSLGQRHAVIWGGIAVSGLVGFYLLHVQGWVPPPMWPLEDLPRANVLAGLFVLVVVIVVILVYEGMRKHALDEMHGAQARAQDASRAKSEFLANMSHEVRTPLHGLLGSLDLLERTTLAPRQIEHLRLMRSSGRNLVRVVDDILDFSKLEAGRVRTVLEEVHLVEAVEQVATNFAIAANNKELELLVDVSPELSKTVYGDTLRLQQVLTNLISNAVKFTESGQVVMRVRPEEADARAVTVCFEVSDTGPGIAEETLARLFRPFEQAESSAARRFGGTGLGLAISSSLVELMGGRLIVETRVGEGSTFRFQVRFPLQVGAGRVSQIGTLQGVQVVVVTPYEPLAETVSRHIRWAGGQSSQVSDLSKLPQRLDGLKDEGDVVALVDLPHASAFELVGQARARCGPLPVVALCPVQLDIDEVVAAGAAAAVSKPVRANQLLDAINSALTPESAPPSSVRGLEPLGGAGKDGQAVLVAEDNPVNQLVVEGHLRLMGYQAELVANGREAFDRWAAEPEHFYAILMDCHMPVMDGYEATRRIREREQADGLRPTPIIAVTADVMPETEARIRASGMDDVLAKPFVSAALERSLSCFHSGTESETPTATVAPAPALNPATLDQLEELGPELRRELLTVFVEDARRRMAAILEAQAGGDDERIRQEAHALKGASGNIGADAMSQICSAIEAADASELNRLLASAQPELERACREAEGLSRPAPTTAMTSK